MASKIISTGGYLPEKVVTNLDLEGSIDTTDEWIRSRTGIAQRHIAAEGEFTSHLGYNAALVAIHNSSKEIVVYFESPNRLVGTLTVLSEKLSHTQRVVVARELTKKFEEIYRGTTNDVLHHFENGVKGECVIVIEPSNSVVKDPAITNIEEALKLLISNRVSSKNSIEIVQLLNGISKNDIKEIFRIKKSGSQFS